MVQLIGDDGVALAEEHLEDAPVGVEAGGVEDGVVGAEERRQRGFQVLVQGLGAADEADARHPKTPLVQGISRRSDDVGVVREAEIVVGAEVQRIPGCRRNVGRLGRGQSTLGFVEPRRPDLLDRRGEFVADCSVHGHTSQFMTTLPHCPERAMAKASAQSAAATRWVITERTASVSTADVCNIAPM